MALDTLPMGAVVIPADVMGAVVIGDAVVGAVVGAEVAGCASAAVPGAVVGIS